MGLFKLALIGGAAYYAGKKFNEHQEGQQGYQGGCHRGRRWRQEQQQQQQNDPSQFLGFNKNGQGVSRDIQEPAAAAVYQDYPEKTGFSSQYYNTNNNDNQHQHHDHHTYHQPQPQSLPRDIKSPQPQTPSPTHNVQMVKFDEQVETVHNPPTYTGSQSPFPPQMRMYPNTQAAMGTRYEQGEWQFVPRSESAPPMRQQEQQQQLQRPQQMVFTEPKERSWGEKLMWK